MLGPAYVKRDSVKHYFPLPNVIFQLGLHPHEIIIYAYLMRMENRDTYQCWPSYKTIGRHTGLSPNTVRKYVALLEEHGLIRTERTTVFTRDGLKRNGSLRYTILPIRNAVECYHQRQVKEVELAAARHSAEREAARKGICYTPPDSP